MSPKRIITIKTVLPDSITDLPFRPLGILKTLMEVLGFEVTHCYEDLVFVEHNAFLLRMEERGEEVSLFFNTESDVDKRDEIEEQLKIAGRAHNLIISCSGLSHAPQRSIWYY